MKVNLPAKIQIPFNLTRTLPEQQELSPLSRKNIFSKTKKSVSSEVNGFSPHLEKINTNYYVKENNIMPYSYTSVENCMSQQIQGSQFKNVLKVNKTKSSGSKIHSLKDFSCIETVSEKSGKENESDQNSELEISRSFKPKQINSQISSPIEFKNFQSTFTMGNMKKSELSFMKSHEIHKIGKKYTETDSIPIRSNKIKLMNYDQENYKKTNKICFNRKSKVSQHCTLSTRVFEVRISPPKKGDFNFSQAIDVHESSVIFDYNKFYRKRSKSPSPQRQPQSIFHPINEKIFKFFGQEKQKQNFLRISNQNDSFIDIVKEINSPANKMQNRNIFMNQTQRFMQQPRQIQGRNQIFSSELTCLVKEGPRSYSVSNDLRKLSGQRNNVSQSKKDSFVFRTQTIPTTGRSQYINQFEIHTPNKQSMRITQNSNHPQFNDSHRIALATNAIENNCENKFRHDSQDRRLIKNLFGENCPSPKIDGTVLKMVSQQQTPTRYMGIERNQTNNSKDSKRRSSKGISVCSKEKRPQNTQNSNHQRPGQNIVVVTKLKSLQQIKNMKKLSLASPKKIQNNQVGSPIRYKKR